MTPELKLNPTPSIEKQRSSYENKWETIATSHNLGRSTLRAMRGKDFISAHDVMLAEAHRDNEEYDQTHPETPTLEYELEDRRVKRSGYKLRPQRFALSADLEKAPEEALRVIVSRDTQPKLAHQIIHNTRVRMPDGSLVAYDEFIAPVIEKQKTLKNTG